MVLQLIRRGNRDVSGIKELAIGFLQSTTLKFSSEELRKSVAYRTVPAMWVSEAVRYLDVHHELAGLTPEIFIAAVAEAAPDRLPIFDCPQGKSWIEAAALKMSLEWGKYKLEKFGRALFGR